MSIPTDEKKIKHYKIALETYRLNFLYNYDPSMFNDDTVKYICSIEEKFNDPNVDIKKLKIYLDELDAKVLMEQVKAKNYEENDARVIVRQIIKLNKNDYITRSLSLDDYIIYENLKVAKVTPFTSYRACSYYFVDRLKQLTNTLSNPIELSKYPKHYAKFYDVMKDMSDADFETFSEYLEKYLQVEVKKNKQLLMSTTSSNLMYADQNDFNISKNYDGFNTVLLALSDFTKKAISNRISIDDPYYPDTKNETIKIFLNQDVCLAYDSKGKVKNLMEYYLNINPKERIKLNKKAVKKV